MSKSETTACTPDILLVWEMYNNITHAPLLLPEHTLKSMARLQARTPLVLELGMDMVVSQPLVDRLISPTDRDAKEELEAMVDHVGGSWPCTDGPTAG